MKKNLLYLFTVLCTLSFFTSCGDDDEKPQTGIASGSYNTADKTLGLKLNGADVDGKTVTIASTSPEAATVTLTNIIIGQPSLAINATVAGSGDNATLTGSSKDENSETSIEGTVKSGVLSLSVTYKSTSAFVGTWIVPMESYVSLGHDGKPVTGERPSFIVNLENKSGSVIFGEGQVTNQIFTEFVKTMVGGYATNLKSIEFKTDGSIAIVYTKLGTTEEKTLTGLISYYIANKQLFIVPNMGAMMSAKADAGLGGLESLLTNGVPMGYTLEGNKAGVFVTRDLLVSLLPLLPMLDKLLKDNPMYPMLKPMLTQLTTIISESTKFELGMNLEKK